MTQPTWIEHDLRRYFQSRISSGEVYFDLNRNGRFEENEKVSDANRDHYLSPDEWGSYLQNHRSSLARQFPQSFFSWTRRLSPTNPAHDTLHLFYSQRTAGQFPAAYRLIELLTSEVREQVRADMSPQEKMRVVMHVLDRHFQIAPQGINFLNALTQRRLDCKTSSLLIQTIAHELGWPVFLVALPNHIFSRWDERSSENPEGFHANFDWALSSMDSSGYGSLPDSYYQHVFNVSQESIDRGFYLTNLTREEVMALERDDVLMNAESSPANALQGIDRCIAISPHPYLLYNKALILIHLDRLNDAQSILESLSHDDPNSLRILQAQVDLYRHLNHSEAQVSTLERYIPLLEAAYRDSTFFYQPTFGNEANISVDSTHLGYLGMRSFQNLLFENYGIIIRRLNQLGRNQEAENWQIRRREWIRTFYLQYRYEGFGTPTLSRPNVFEEMDFRLTPINQMMIYRRLNPSLGGATLTFPE